MNIQINGLNWTIDKATCIEGNPHTLGRTYYDTLHIVINETIEPSNFHKVLIHELTHAFLYSYGFDQVKLNDEVMCDFISVHAENIIKVATMVWEKILINKKENEND